MVHKLDEFFLVGRVFIAFLLIDSVLDEDFLQRSVEVFLFQLAFLDLEFPFEERFGVLAGELKQIADGSEDRFTILDYAAVRRDIHLTIREGIEGVDRFVGRRTRCQLHDDTCLIGRSLCRTTNPVQVARRCVPDRR